MNLLDLLLAIVIKGSLVLLCAVVVTGLFRRQSAAMRHIVWVLAFAGMLALPLTIPFAPKVELPVAFWQATKLQHTGSAQVSGANKVTAAYAPGAKTGSNTDASDSAQEGIVEPMSWLGLSMLILWAAGFLYVIGRSLVGLYSLQKLRITRTRKMSAEELSADVCELEDNVGLRRSWELRQNAGDEPASALTWGIRQPVVLVPSGVHGWSRQRQEAVLLHELAHVRRLDFLSQSLAEVACALYWFNPLVWLGARALRAEAESAADDVVLRSGLRPSVYAEELLRIAAEIGHRRRLVTHPGIPVMNAKKIEARLESVLSPVTRRGLTLVQTLAAVSLSIIAVPAIAGLQATTPQTDDAKRAERTEAMIRMKAIGLGSLMYAQDYDEYLPYAQKTESASSIIHPYVKNQESFKSPTAGAKFLYNVNVGGVPFVSFDLPAEIPMWMESLPTGSSLSPAYCFIDGHVKLLRDDSLADAKKMAARHFERPKWSKPLPADYIIKWPTLGGSAPAVAVPTAPAPAKRAGN